VSEPSTSFSFSLPSTSDSSSYSSIKRSQPCRRFQLHEIQLATKSFDETLVVGIGSFGKVYKGKIFDGSSLVVAAIKRLDSKSNPGAAEFWPEVEMLSTFGHCNIVSLIGYCNQGEKMVLVYEYIPNGSLYDHLHKLGTPLSWLQRLNICIDVGRGLHYLHTGVEVGVIHHDIKSANVLLDETWTAKITDLGLAKISDVYAFGVVLFEVLCRKRAVDTSHDEEHTGLAIWAVESIKKGKLTQILDSDIRDQICPQSLKEFVRTAEACLHRDPEQRPTMAEALGSLEAALTLQEKFNNSLQPTPTPSRRTIMDRIFGGNYGIHDRMGMSVIPLKDLITEERKSLRISDSSNSQKKKSHGQITVEILYKTLVDDKIPIDFAVPSQKPPIGTPNGGGLLILVIHECENLEGKYHTNPSVSFTFQGKLRKTRPMKKNHNPRWGKDFEFTLANSPTNDILHLEVVSTSWKKLTHPKESMGHIDISLADVVNNKRTNERYNLVDSKNGRLRAELLWITA
ncbi:receptor-like protein kinase FERONIA, partial [Tanacetum coccineum]